MSTAREQALQGVTAGDVIYGIAAGGQQKILLVYKADQNGFWARHVTTGTKVEFGRDGRSRQPTWDGGSCTIVSVAKLPSDEHEVAIGLDRKMRSAKKLADLRLSEAEKHLLLTVHDFFKARLLPDGD
jgi:hypothetical protein